jgi:hypothetical protein
VGKASRDKGVRGELEVFKVIEDHLGISLKRNSQEQYEQGGCDQYLHYFALEIKRCETLKLESWWKETVDQTPYEYIPTLIYRQSRQPWRVMLPFSSLSPIMYENLKKDEKRFFAYENTITIFLEPMFMDVVRETMSASALADMQDNVHLMNKPLLN